MQKNPDPITKHEWYMGMALVTAKRSKDPKTQVGCAIVDDGGVVVSVGYNGMPTSCGDDVSTCPPPEMCLLRPLSLCPKSRSTHLKLTLA